MGHMISVPLVTLICEWLISCYPLRYAYYVSQKKEKKKRKKEKKRNTVYAYYIIFCISLISIRLLKVFIDFTEPADGGQYYIFN